jgi:hypothetical protein
MSPDTADMALAAENLLRGRTNNTCRWRQKDRQR